MTLITVDQYGGLIPKGLHVKIYCDLMQDGIDKKKEIECALKLHELVKKRIIPLEKELEIIVNTKNGIKSCGSDYHLITLNERNYYQTLLDESSKTVKEKGSGGNNHD